MSILMKSNCDWSVSVGEPNEHKECIFFLIYSVVHFKHVLHLFTFHFTSCFHAAPVCKDISSTWLDGLRAECC